MRNADLSPTVPTLFRISGWAALCVACALAAAPEGARAGTGLAYLEIGAGARAIALGNAVVSNVDGPEATYWNPGAVPLLGGTQAELMHTESFQTIRYEFATLTRTFGRHGLGASFHGVWTDDIRSYDESGTFLGDIGYAGLAVSGTYGLAVTENLGIGVGIEYLREQIDVADATGLGFSFGARARELLPRTDFGASVLHVGSSMKYESEEFDLPTTVQGGITHRLPLQAFNGQMLVSAEIRKVRDTDAQALFGTEYRYKEYTRLQVGYQTNHDTQDVSFGVGVGMDHVRGQYAFAPFGDDLGDQHRFSVQLAW